MAFTDTFIANKSRTGRSHHQLISFYTNFTRAASEIQAPLDCHTPLEAEAFCDLYNIGFEILSCDFHQTAKRSTTIQSSKSLVVKMCFGSKKKYRQAASAPYAYPVQPYPVQQQYPMQQSLYPGPAPNVQLSHEQQKQWMKQQKEFQHDQLKQQKKFQKGQEKLWEKQQESLQHQQQKQWQKAEK